MGNIVKKILVANRGEIALRVVRTAREMGISTVAVYSEQDRNAQYVQLADESYLLSGDTYASTYLNEDLLIGILHRSGANAVHPGYGFLSEVPSFADKVEKAGAIWVGPHPQALIDLGDKITARRVAKSAQVPPVPGISEPVRELRTLLDFSHTYGYPVMMKRTDGGGGRGITVVHDDDEMRRFYLNHDAMQGGDLDEYFIEKFIDKARHVETQCGRDRFGDFTVYSTRDCSVQRRNQKLVEEAPAPFLPDEVINQLETYSRSLFNKVDYIGLGTCEFMVTEQGKVYFLEVNPRLQVEHTALLDMVYGPDGETPVEDDELTSHLDDSMYEICYISIPLYNTSTYAFADDDQKAEMLKLAQAAADSVNAAGGEMVSDQVSALHEAAQNALPDIYAVLDGKTSDDSASVQTELLTESDVASAFTQDGAADALRSLSYGEAAAVQINSSTLLLMVRVDPLSVSSLDDLRSQILSDMKGGELNDALAAGGAELAHDLDSSAMNKLPAKKIVNNSANS